MAQSKKEIEAVLAAAGTRPKHRFGQNFMIDQNLVRLVADAGRVGTDDMVIEVGPGTGTLTEELLSRGARVIAVEIDRDLAAALRTRFAGEARFELIEGDALSGKHEINPQLIARISAQSHVKLVANLPYNIASPLVIELLIAGVELLAFTVQKEVADRLRAGAGEDAYGPLSVMAQLLGKVEVLRTLPPQAFWPAPKIESALVRITRTPPTRTLGKGHGGGRDSSDAAALQEQRTRAPAPLPEYMAGELSRFIHSVFSYRRKTLKRALVEAGHNAESVLGKTGLDGHLRPEQFTPQQFLEMFRASPSEKK